MKFNFFTFLFLACCVSGNVWALSEDQRPDYQKEYDAYLKDLQVIEQKGYAPKNSVLEDDLAKMSSEERIRLTHPFSYSFDTKSSEQLKMAENDSGTVQAPKNDAEIVNRVEIIRVPEEFREQYAKVYAEETKHISAQSLARDQEAERQKALEDEDALKVAEHDNPFRLLKEKSLETTVPAKKKDSVTKAYFKEQKRAYVSGDPIIIEKKEVKKAENEVEEVAVNDKSESNSSAPGEITPKYSAKSHIYHLGGPNNDSSASQSSFGRGARASKMFLE